MRNLRDQKGQAVIEYAFLMVLLATITFAVIALAGNQLKSLYSDVAFEFAHLTDASLYSPDGTQLAPGTSPTPGACPSGSALQLRGHKWHCG
jgi:Flp pilus assembly pilin Flp